MNELLPPFHMPMNSDIRCHMANDYIAELEAENKKAVYGCCEECRALSEAEADLAALRTNHGPVSDSQCDRCQLDASVRADKAEAELAEATEKLRVKTDEAYHDHENAWASFYGMEEQRDDWKARSTSQVEKTIEARQETHLAIIQKRQAEAQNKRLDSHTQFWMTAMMAVRFYHELGDDFDCRAAMKSLAEAAEREEGEGQ